MQRLLSSNLWKGIKISLVFLLPLLYSSCKLLNEFLPLFFFVSSSLLFTSDSGLFCFLGFFGQPQLFLLLLKFKNFLPLFFFSSKFPNKRSSIFLTFGPYLLALLSFSSQSNDFIIFIMCGIVNSLITYWIDLHLEHLFELGPRFTVRLIHTFDF